MKFFSQGQQKERSDLGCALGDPLLEILTGFRLKIRLGYKTDRYHCPGTQPGLQLLVCKHVSLKCNLLPFNRVEAIITINALITRSTLYLMNMPVHRVL